MKHIQKTALALSLTSILFAACTDKENEPLISASYPASVTLEVPESLQPYIYVDSTNAKVLPLLKGQSADLSYSMTPDNVTYPDVVWASGTPAVATVDANGHVNALAAGYSIVQVAPQIAYSGSGLISVIKVVVSDALVPAQSITINSDSTWMYAQESLQLSADILPTTATYHTVQWTSSDESIATVDMNGLVTGQVGPNFEANVTITATALDNSGVTASKTLKVVQIVQPQSISLEQTYSADNYEWAIGEKTYTVGYTTVPAACTKSAIVWTSSDENIATVQNGVVHFNQNGDFGNVTITATCPETGNSSSVTLLLAEGLIRELYKNANNITWDLSEAHKSNGGTSSLVSGHLHVTTYTVNATTQRGDFTKTDPKIWLNATNYPILALRITDVKDEYAAAGVTTRNINVDSNTSDGSYKGSLGGGNNKWIKRYKLNDGSYVLIYDLATQTFATGGLLSGTVAFTTFQWKYADIKSVATTVSYDVFWVQTFKTEAALQAFVASEGMTYTEE